MHESRTSLIGLLRKRTKVVLWCRFVPARLLIYNKKDSSMDIIDILNKMTLKEKVSLLFAKDWWNTQGIDRVGINSIKVSDGPHGLRKEIFEKDRIYTEKATCFPPAVTSACSFDTELIEKMGCALANEAIKENVDIILGPGTNIKRSSLCGRNFEYFSEDPYLAGKLAASFINGVQSKGVGTSLKHFAANNQETYRAIESAEIDERTLHEIYLKPFEIAVKESSPWTVMCSYNKLNGIYASQNKYLLTEVLRDFWGYDGIVVSDWGAVDDRVKGIIAGLDIEFPYSGHYNFDCVIQAVLDGKITTYEIDCCVLRILKLIEKVNSAPKTHNYDIENHHQIAKEIAQNSIVLIKNDENLLPFSQNEKLLVIGALAKYPRYQGSGSSKIIPTKLVNVLDGLDTQNIKYDFVEGYDISGDIADYQLIAKAVSACQNYKNIAVFIGLTEDFESEGYDRRHMRLPEAQYALIDELLKVREDFAVIFSGGSPVELDNINKAKSLIIQYLTGQAADAVVDIIFGKVNPSGKLAETWPVKLEDSPSFDNFTYDNNSSHYKETLFVGYRYYDTFDCPCVYPFGYGLSYTSFAIDNISLKINERLGEITVKLTVKNTGYMDGAEVVQVYTGKSESAIVRPKKELKSFKKVFLKKDESKEIELSLPLKSLAFYNTIIKDWVIEGGEYLIFVGNSSKDILFTDSINIQGDKFLLPSYIPPKKPVLNDEEFSMMLGRPLNPKSVKRMRPFDLNSTIKDLSATLVGRLLKKKLKNFFKGSSQEEMLANEETINSLMELPLRMVAMLSNGVLSKKGALGIVDIANRKYFRGLKKLITSNRK